MENTQEFNKEEQAMGNAIKQTNRTMLMETVNPEKLDILTLVGDVRGIESLSDDKIKEISYAS